MRWANSDVERESDPRWFLVPATLRAHHHALIIACSREENGGVLRDCRDRSDLWWWALAGFRRRVIPKLAAEGLVEWVDEGRSLRVSFYDTTHEAIAIASRHHARKMAELRWAAYAARRAAGIASGSAGGFAPSSAAGFAPDPDPDPDPSGSPDGEAFAGRSLPSPKGGAGGGKWREGERAPAGADEAGPEGFEAWWSEYVKTRPTWRGRVLDLWVAEDLEGEADEIRAFCRYKARSHQWRQRGPEGQPRHYVPTPWRLLKKGEWRKLGPWSSTPAPAAPERSKSHQTTPQVVDAGLVDVTSAVGWLDQLLADPDIDEPTKERHRRDWAAAHPGQQPPWANGRAS